MGSFKRDCKMGISDLHLHGDNILYRRPFSLVSRESRTEIHFCPRIISFSEHPTAKLLRIVGSTTIIAIYGERNNRKTCKCRPSYYSKLPQCPISLLCSATHTCKHTLTPLYTHSTSFLYHRKYVPKQVIVNWKKK